MQKIGLGGGCHWCTEAVFQSLKGVRKVEQGWLAPKEDPANFSEGVLVHFEPKQISLHVLVAIHLHTHSATSNHSMRKRYRSAIYVFSEEQNIESRKAINDLKRDFEQPVITEILTYGNFELNNERLLEYYYQAPQRPFCQTYIHPKLKILLEKFKAVVNEEKILGNCMLNNYLNPEQ